jgi:hypothetical protein
VTQPLPTALDVLLGGISVAPAITLASGVLILPPSALSNAVVPLTGTLTANVTLSYVGSAPNAWRFDASGGYAPAITFNGHTIFFSANGNVWGTSLTAAGVVELYFNGAKFYGVALSP